MTPENAARRLIGLAAEIEPFEVEVQRFPVEEAEVAVLEQEYRLHQQFRAPAEDMLNDLQGALSDTGWAPIPTGSADAPPASWSFGTAMTLRGPSREIHHGFLDPIRTVPILTAVPEQVVLYLITIDDGEDYLKNETHSGVGWHYHYLDWRKDRSDVILCWDTRWTAPVPHARRGLFVEKHAEGGKPFRAKPWLWGERKRESMYRVCSDDLQKRRIEEYRCAANKADPVYPLDAILTPHSASHVLPSPKSSTKRGKRKKR